MMPQLLSHLGDSGAWISGPGSILRRVVVTDRFGSRLVSALRQLSGSSFLRLCGGQLSGKLRPGSDLAKSGQEPSLPRAAFGRIPHASEWDIFQGMPAFSRVPLFAEIH